MIVLAVRWYLRFGLSYRDVEELVVEPGIAVNHVTVYRWVCYARVSTDAEDLTAIATPWPCSGSRHP